jgi:hypothetical protein
MPAGSLVNTNLRLFQPFAATRRHYLVDCSGQGGVSPYWNGAPVQSPFHCSCGLGHARLRHLSPDAGT